MTVKKGDKIKVEYEGKFEDGTVFDSTEKHGQLLEFEVGAGKVIKGFDAAVEGMKADEEKEVKIKSDDGYGPYREELKQKVPKDKLPKDQEPKEGMMLMVNLPTGQQVPATIKEITDSDVTIDLNHPLAGKDLNFKLKVKEIN